MKDEIRIWLTDIERAIQEINSFLPNRRNFNEFKTDLKTKRAVERNIEIIGEAMSRILKESTEIEITNARKIVDTRNRIIHGYDTVSDEILWGIVNKNLPVLEEEIKELLEA
jgi:uncharacterized protein with HEPN domain